MSNNYEDIIRLPHHVSKTRPQMPAIDRAAQFAPFAALTGYDDAVKETARLTDRRIELDDDTKGILNDKLHIAIESSEARPELLITYFMPDERKSGGAYITEKAIIKRIDEYERLVILEDKSTIPIDDIYEIEGEIFKGLFL